MGIAQRPSFCPRFNKLLSVKRQGHFSHKSVQCGIELGQICLRVHPQLFSLADHEYAVRLKYWQLVWCTSTTRLLWYLCSSFNKHFFTNYPMHLKSAVTIDVVYDHQKWGYSIVISMNCYVEFSESPQVYPALGLSIFLHSSSFHVFAVHLNCNLHVHDCVHTTRQSQNP